MSAHLSRFCLNCEEPITELNNVADFCSSSCEKEYAAQCDPELLNRATNSNPDALPMNESLQQARWAKPAHSTSSSGKDGILPPNSIEAITSMLNTSGISQASIAEAVKNLTPDKSKPE